MSAGDMARRNRCTAWISLLIPLVVAFSGCAGHRDRRAEVDCEWHEEDSHRLDLQRFADRAHLRDDAIVAEDRAIGHADSGVGRRPALFIGIAGYDRARNECMERLFSRISTGHGVPLDVVREYRLRRNRLADAAAIGVVDFDGGRAGRPWTPQLPHGKDSVGSTPLRGIRQWRHRLLAYRCTPLQDAIA